jgi:hypothetical protein
MSDIAVAESGTRLQNFLDRAGLRGFPWKTATILYTISWGWLFIVRDSFWGDDWDEFKFRGLTNFDYYAFGFAPWKRTIYWLFEAFGPAPIRLLTFVCFYLSSIFLFGIIKKFEFVEKSSLQSVSLLFLLVPFNTVRVGLNVFFYTTAYMYFFAAWFCLVCLKSKGAKIIGVALFFLSFQMFTLLVFFVVPMAHYFYIGFQKYGFKSLEWILKNSVLLSLPIIYWLLRSRFWPLTSEYHVITRNKIVGFLTVLVIFILLVIILSVFYYLSKKFRRSLILMSVGISLMFVGYVPYLIYGLVGYGLNVPVNYLVIMLGRSDWFSRHQILQPLGFSILLIGVIGLLPSIARGFKSSIVGVILAISVVFNVAFGFEYVVDHSKQMSIVAALAAKPNRTAGGEIQMVDQTTFLNARQRSYRERDWLGLVGLAEGIDSAKKLNVVGGCSENPNTRLVLIQGPETHWEALKNWVSDGDMGFKVTVDDSPGACKPEMVTSEKVSGAIPILFYFTGAKG